MPKKTKDKIDLEELKFFYNPHPGFGGPAVRLPIPIKEAADHLNDRRITVKDALEYLNKALENSKLTGRFEVSEPNEDPYKGHEACILFWLDEKGGWEKGGPTHLWRLIMFKEI